METYLEVQDYMVAIICPLPVELSAMILMLDERHTLPRINIIHDDNNYNCGSICGHNVVLVNLPLRKNGNISASSAINTLHRTFTNIQVTLLVGIGGGLPSEEGPNDPGKNIYLGDVVIGWDGDRTQPIVHWDAGRVARVLPLPDRRILNALGGMKSMEHLSEAKHQEYLSKCTTRKEFIFPGRDKDRLYETAYLHKPNPSGACINCDSHRLIRREVRSTNDFQVHFGKIVSLESVVNTADVRDQIRDVTGALCVEMEAAGILERKNCLVIRGISDYADSHKNNLWKPYASATAASVAREFLSILNAGVSPEHRPVSTTLHARTTPNAQNEHYLLPRDPTSLFTGRQRLLDEMRNVYFPTTSVSISGQKRYVVHGLGGVGKTELCLKFAEQFREKFWGIFMIDASSRRSIERGFVTIAKDCEVEEDVDVVKRLLSNSSALWLLILDNADNPKVDLSSYFPVGDRGMVLITTRNRDALKYATVGSHELGKMDMTDAVTLLLRNIDYTANTISDNARRTQAQNVVASLGCLALAIEKVGAGIRNSSYSVEEYSNKYCNPDHHLATKANGKKQDNFQQMVFHSWEVSLQMMKDSSPETGQDAVDLLHIFSYFHYNGVSEKIWERACHKPVATLDLRRILTYRQGLLGRSKTYDWSPNRINKAVSTLLSFSLISRDKNGLLSIHPLVQNWARDRARNKLSIKLAEQLWAVAVYILGASITRTFTMDDFLYRRWIIPHIESCLEATSYRRLFEINKSSRGWLCILENLALAYAENCRRQEVVQLMEGILKARIEMLGQSHSETLRAMDSLARAYSAIASYSQALQQTEKVVEFRQIKLGENDPETLSSKYSLAVRYADMGQPKKALRMLKVILQKQEVTLGGNHSDVLRSKHSLAGIYGEMGWYDEAYQLAEIVSETRKRMLGENHPETLNSMHNLAIWMGKKGQKEEAFALIKKVAQRRKVFLSKEHPDTLRSMYSMSLYYADIGQTEDALQVMESVVETRKRVLGEDHPDTKRAYNAMVVLGEKVWEERKRN